MTVHDAVSGTSQPAVRQRIVVPTFRYRFFHEKWMTRFLTHASCHLTNDRSHSISRKSSKLPRKSRWMNSRLCFEWKSIFNERVSQSLQSCWRVSFWNLLCKRTNSIKSTDLQPVPSTSETKLLSVVREVTTLIRNDFQTTTSLENEDWKRELEVKENVDQRARERFGELSNDSLSCKFRRAGPSISHVSGPTTSNCHDVPAST